MTSSAPCSALPLADQLNLIEKLEVFKIQGRDKRGRKVLRIIGKFLPAARLVSREALNKYLEDRIFPKLNEKPFSVVYVHTDVQRGENSPGISILRPVYEAIPGETKDLLEAVYFVHPALQTRLFLATFGRFLFSGGLYGKISYVSRLQFLWDHVRRTEIEIPKFAYDYDEELDYRPMFGFGIESDLPNTLAMFDSPRYRYSMRCIP